MNREIKFRGKRKGDGKWVYGYYTKAKLYNLTKIRFQDEDCSWIALEVEPETVGQFTGLLDINGKEIYEGDIVKAHIEKSDFITEVKWGANSRGWSLKCDRRNERWGTIKYYALPASHNIEVISNIHDDKELLKN